MSGFILIVTVALGLAACVSTPARDASPESGAETAPEWPVILRVKVREVEATDWHPVCAEEDCIPARYWFKYRARVKDVVEGSWGEKEVEFTHLQHALYVSEVTRDCYVVLRPAGKDLSEKLGVLYSADRILSRYWESNRAEIDAF